MDENITEEQQVEEIKKWWKENGSSVVTGALFGLALVFGWRSWNEWREGNSEAASALYQQVIAAKADATLVQAIGGRLIEEYPDSVYAFLGAFAQAATLLEKGDTGGGQGRLEWAVLHAPDANLKALAQLRLARLLLDQGDLARAQTLAETAANNGFPAESAELRGDIFLRQGDRNAARRLYQESLKKLPGNSQRTASLQMKIDDLAK